MSPVKLEGGLTPGTEEEKERETDAGLSGSLQGPEGDMLSGRKGKLRAGVLALPRNRASAGRGGDYGELGQHACQPRPHRGGEGELRAVALDRPRSRRQVE